MVVIDACGTGKSPGFYEMMAPLQTRDYYDAIEWARMRRFLAKFSESEASNHTPSLAAFTTNTPELKFSVHTAV